MQYPRVLYTVLDIIGIMVLLYYTVSYGIIIQCHVVLVPGVKHFQTEGN